MFVEDMTVHPHYKTIPLLAVGWLATGTEFEKGSVPLKLIEMLKELAFMPNLATLGIHPCDFCDNDPDFVALIDEKGWRHSLGSSVSYVADGKKAFVVPNLIYHYVKDHDYLPPQEFIDTLFNMPAINSDAYIELMNALSLRIPIDYSDLEDIEFFD